MLIQSYLILLSLIINSNQTVCNNNKLIQMRKVQIKEELSNDSRIQEKSIEDSQQLIDQPEELLFKPRLKKKQSMFITYQGCFLRGVFNFTQSLTLLYTTVTLEHWKIAYGQKSGISQNASHNDKSIVWNFPFEMTYQTKNPQGWPQVVVVVYSTDFLGRSVAKGYGNIHLPTSPGQHKRKIRIFQTIPASTLSNCCAFVMGYINQLKQPEKVLLENEGGRQCLQVKPNGQIQIRLDVRRYNFQDYGYQ